MNRIVVFNIMFCLIELRQYLKHILYILLLNSLITLTLVSGLFFFQKHFNFIFQGIEIFLLLICIFSSVPYSAKFETGQGGRLRKSSLFLFLLCNTCDFILPFNFVMLKSKFKASSPRIKNHWSNHIATCAFHPVTLYPIWLLI